MKISHRLYLMVAPGIFGVLLTAGLAYWGQYAHSAPFLVVVLAASATIFSLILAWTNARYIARRIERLARRTPGDASPPSLTGLASAGAPGRANAPSDEIDEIEDVVERLSNTVTSAAQDRSALDKAFEQRARDYAALLASLSVESVKRLEEVRLPLHILLDNHFGELNENQEEMLGAARAAAEAADTDMRRLGEIASLELGELHLRQDRIKPSEIVDALRPMLVAAAESATVTIEIDLAPLLPPILGDRAHLQDALVTILRSTIANVREGSSLAITVDEDKGAIRFLVEGANAPRATVTWVAAVRLVQAHGGRVEKRDRAVVVVLPALGRAQR